MADNLTIDISVNTQKARLDLEKLKLQLQQIGRELRDALKQGDDTRALELSKSYEQVRVQVQRLNASLRETATAGRAGATNLINQFGQFGSTLSGIQTVIGQMKTGLAGFGIGLGIKEAADALVNFNDKLLNISRTAATVDLDPQLVKDYRKEVEKTSGDADSAMLGLRNFNKMLLEQRVEARNNGQALEQGVRVYKGITDAAKTATSEIVTMRGALSDSKNAATSMIQVWRGGEVIKTDLANPLKAASITAGQYTDAQIKAGRALRDFINNLNEMKKQGRTAEAEAIAFGVFGKNIADVVESYKPLLALIDQMDKKKGGLDKPIENAKAFKAALVEVQDSTAEIPESIYKALTPLATDFLTKLDASNKYWNDKTKEAWNATVTFMGDRWNLLVAGIKAMPDEVGQAFTELGTAFSNAFDVAFANVKQGWDDLVAWFWSNISKIGDALSSFGSKLSAPGGVLPAPGLASGGMVSGPGSGTSDSVLARLSNGEFVMRARAVEHFGPRFMAALNALRNPLTGYSLGGLVDRQHHLPRFAEGGMVSTRTSDGATVNLHFPGGSFSLRGDKGIVMGLTREARRAALLSGGRAPGAAVV